MNIMHSVYDRNGERWDFCDDEDHEHYVEYLRDSDTLVVRQWCGERQAKGEPPPIIAEFFQPVRCVRDWTL